MERELNIPREITSDNNIKMPMPFIIGVSGGRASGKTSICKAIHEFLGNKNCSVLSLSSNGGIGESILDFQEISSIISELKKENSGVYKVESQCFRGEVHPTKIILIEGNTIFNDSSLRELIDLKIFVQTDDDERLARRVLSLSDDKKGEVLKVIEQHRKFEKPEYEMYIAPTVKYADIIIPRGVENKGAMNVLRENLMVKVNDS